MQDTCPNGTLVRNSHASNHHRQARASAGCLGTRAIVDGQRDAWVVKELDAWFRVAGARRGAVAYTRAPCHCPSGPLCQASRPPPLRIQRARRSPSPLSCTHARRRLPSSRYPSRSTPPNASTCTGRRSARRSHSTRRIAPAWRRRPRCQRCTGMPVRSSQ